MGQDWCRLMSWRVLYQQQERPARKELSWRHRKLAIWMYTAKAKVHLCLTKLAPVARNYGKHVCSSDLVVGSWCREHGQAAFAMQMQPFDNLHQHDNRHKSDECLEEVSKVLPVANDWRGLAWCGLHVTCITHHYTTPCLVHEWLVLKWLFYSTL